ncbi:hypothetical protein BHE74_00050585, partial [Ensete ventricosum]
CEKGRDEATNRERKLLTESSSNDNDNGEQRQRRTATVERGSGSSDRVKCRRWNHE